MDTSHIGKKSVVEDMITLEDFCEKMNYNYENGIFFEADLDGSINCANIYDVIVMDKVNIVCSRKFLPASMMKIYCICCEIFLF